MTTPPPPVVVREKRGMGCFGCGCLVVLVVLILLAALVGGLSYFAYTKGMTLTSTTPGGIQTFDGGDDVYHGAEQKLTTFNEAVQQNQPATLELSADEVNTLIARSPDLAGSQIHLFLSFTDSTAHVQASLPTNLLPFGIIKDRYINGDSDFIPGLDPSTKSVTLVLQRLRIGSEEVPKGDLSTLQSEMEPAINTQLQKTPAIKQVLDRATFIGIKGGKLLIQTQ
jgi:hypothetical protein